MVGNRKLTKIETELHWKQMETKQNQKALVLFPLFFISFLCFFFFVSQNLNHFHLPILIFYTFSPFEKRGREQRRKETVNGNKKYMEIETKTKQKIILRNGNKMKMETKTKR